MQTNEVTLGALERRIDMAVSLADIEQGVAERLKRLSRTVKMAGFRLAKCRCAWLSKATARKCVQK
jgi:trigger factor